MPCIPLQLSTSKFMGFGLGGGRGGLLVWGFFCGGMGFFFSGWFVFSPKKQAFTTPAWTPIYTLT